MCMNPSLRNMRQIKYFGNIGKSRHYNLHKILSDISLISSALILCTINSFIDKSQFTPYNICDIKLQNIAFASIHTSSALTFDKNNY